MYNVSLSLSPFFFSSCNYRLLINIKVSIRVAVILFTYKPKYQKLIHEAERENSF